MDISMELTEEELLVQVAQEAANLAVAAGELNRIRNSANPEAVNEREAEMRLLEGMAMMRLCIEELTKKVGGGMVIAAIYANKKGQWKRKLEEAKRSGRNDG